MLSCREHDQLSREFALARAVAIDRRDQPTEHDADPELRDQVLELVRQRGHVSGNEAARVLHRRRGDVQAAIRALDRDGRVRRDSQGWTLVARSAATSQPATAPDALLLTTRTTADVGRATVAQQRGLEPSNGTAPAQNVGHDDSDHDADTTPRPVDARASSPRRRRAAEARP